MKLYTEEQVKAMIEKSQYTGLTADFLILAAPSVQLPSDEEIKEMRKAYLEEVNDIVHADLERDGYLDLGFHVGAKWMRDKIKGDNK